MTKERRKMIEENLRAGLRTKKLITEFDEYIKDVEEHYEMNTREKLKLYALEYPGIGNQKTKITEWIIDNMNSDYQLLKTQREMTEECGEVSINAVMRTLQTLCSGDKPFLEAPMQGVYQVKEDIIKGCEKDD